MATIIPGITLMTGDTIDGNGGALTNKNLNELVSLATIMDVGSGNNEIAAAAIQGGAVFGGVTGTASASTPALRKLGTGANDAAAGNDPRFTDDRTANALRFGTNPAIPLSNTNPTPGQVLHYDGSTIAATTIGASAWVPGNGTADSANSGTDTVVTADVSGAFSFIEVGHLLRLNNDDALVGKVTEKPDNSTLVLGGVNLGTNNNVNWEYQIAPRVRPWNTVVLKGTPDSPVALDASAQGVLFLVDTSSGNVEIALPACSTFGVNSITFKKITDDTNTVTVSRAGSDTIDGATSVVLALINAHLTIVGDGTSRWNVVSSSGVGQTNAGNSSSIVTTMQKLRVTSSAMVAITSQLSLTSIPTISNGTEVLTNGGAVSITPSASNSVIRVRAILNGGNSSPDDSVMAALFKTVGGTPTLCTVVGHGGGQGASKNLYQMILDYEFISGSTSPIVFTLRIAVTGGTYRLNGQGNSATPPFGGNLISFIEVTELSA